jgi:xanthine/uracil permease
MQILYRPDDHVPVSRVILYSIQWLAFNLVNVAVVPLVVGTALGLDHEGIAHLAQRTMFFTSAASLLQILFGHRLPIIEGPAGMWWAVFITLAAMAPAMGKGLPELRTDLETGVMAAGLVLVGLGSTGLMGKALKMFTPA